MNGHKFNINMMFINKIKGQPLLESLDETGRDDVSQVHTEFEEMEGGNVEVSTQELYDQKDQLALVEAKTIYFQDLQGGLVIDQGQHLEEPRDIQQNEDPSYNIQQIIGEQEPRLKKPDLNIKTNKNNQQAIQRAMQFHIKGEISATERREFVSINKKLEDQQLRIDQEKSRKHEQSSLNIKSKTELDHLSDEIQKKFIQENFKKTKLAKCKGEVFCENFHGLPEHHQLIKDTHSHIVYIDNGEIVSCILHKVHDSYNDRLVIRFSTAQDNFQSIVYEKLISQGIGMGVKQAHPHYPTPEPKEKPKPDHNQLQATPDISSKKNQDQEADQVQEQAPDQEKNKFSVNQSGQSKGPLFQVSQPEPRQPDAGSQANENIEENGSEGEGGEEEVSESESQVPTPRQVEPPFTRTPLLCPEWIGFKQVESKAYFFTIEHNHDLLVPNPTSKDECNSQHDYSEHQSQIQFEGVKVSLLSFDLRTLNKMTLWDGKQTETEISSFNVQTREDLQLACVHFVESWGQKTQLSKQPTSYNLNLSPDQMIVLPFVSDDDGWVHGLEIRQLKDLDKPLQFINIWMNYPKIQLFESTTFEDILNNQKGTLMLETFHESGDGKRLNEVFSVFQDDSGLITLKNHNPQEKESQQGLNYDSEEQPQPEVSEHRSSSSEEWEESDDSKDKDAFETQFKSVYENDQINKTLRVVEFKDRIELDTFFSKQSKLRNLICGEESNLSVLVVFPSGETSIIYGKMDSDKTLITSRSKSVVKFGDLSHGLNKLNIAATMQGQSKVIHRGISNVLTSYLEDVDEFSDVLTEKVLVIRGNSITSTRCELNGAFPIVIKVWERERVSFANMEKEMYTTTTDLPSVKSNLVFLAGDSKFFTKLSKFKSSQVGLFYLREDGETKEISYKVCEFSNWTEFKKGEECKNAMSVIVQTLYNSNDDRSLRLLLLIKPGNKSAHLVAFDLKTETIVRHKDLGNIFYGSIEETLPPHQLFSLEQTSEIQVNQISSQNGSTSVKYQLQIRCQQLRLIQILEFDFQTFPCANGDADAGPQAEIEIVGGKLLILKEDCKFNLLKKGGFSALISKETNERCGSLITMSDGNLGSIEIPDQDEGAMQFNREELMCSQIDQFVCGNLYQVQFTTKARMPGSGLPDYHKFKVLNCQLRKLMSVRLFCLRDIIDKEWNEAANFIPRIESPIDANKGYSLASILMSSPDQVKFAIDFYQEYLSEYNTESSLEKIIGSDQKRIEAFREAQLYENIELDTGMGVDQVSIIQMLLEKGDQKRSIQTFLDFMMTQQQSELRNSILMGQLPRIIEGEFCSNIAPMLEQHDPADSNSSDSLIKIEQHLPAPNELSDFLGENLVVRGKNIDMKGTAQWLTEYFSLLKQNFKQIDKFCDKNPIYRVDHSLIDFQEIQLQQNIYAFKNPASFEKMQINHCTLAKMLSQIETQTHGKIEEQKIMKDLVNFQFGKYSYPFYTSLFAIYIVFYQAPFYAQIRSQDTNYKRGCAVSCCTVQVLLLTLEGLQVRKTDFWDYIKDHWNQLDIAVILMNIYYFANKYVVQEEKSSEIANTVLDLAVFVLSFLKLMYFLRIFENFGHLIQMLQNCLIDISVFMVFLLSWILVYTLALDILNSSFDDGDYSNLNAFLASLIQMYRNSIGDIAAPLYARWTKLAEEGTPSQQDQASFIIGLIWTAWVLHQFTVLVILLNFLIAIISQSYENVMTKLEVFKFQTRVNFNLECLQVMECFGVLPEFNTLLIVSQNEDVSTENEWTGIINTIKTYSRQGFRLQREMIQKLFASTAAEIKGTQQDVKDTKLDIQVTKQDVKDIKAQMAGLEGKIDMILSKMDGEAK